MQKGQVELRNEMNCDQGGVQQRGRRARIFGTGAVWVRALTR